MNDYGYMAVLTVLIFVSFWICSGDPDLIDSISYRLMINDSNP